MATKLICLFLLIFSQAVQADSLLFEASELADERLHAKALSLVEHERTKSRRSFEDQFTDSDYQRMATMILQVQRSMADDFPVGDGLTFAMYILRIFAEIGDYDLTREEIQALFSTFTRLTRIEIPEQVRTIVAQLERLSFGRREGKWSVAFHTRARRVIRVSMEDGTSDEVIIPHGSTLYFQEMTSPYDHVEISQFMKTLFKLPALPTGWFSRFNQIYPEVNNSIDIYLDRPAVVAPMKVEIHGPRLDLRVPILGQLNMSFRDAYLTPGLKDRLGLPLPSFHIWATNGGMIKAKTSIAE